MSSGIADWWSTFGDAYEDRDASTVDDAAARAAAPSAPLPTLASALASPQDALKDQLALNARTLAQLRAKSQLLEISEASAARLRVEIDELRAATAARERALQGALDEARSEGDALRASLEDATREAEHGRLGAAEARAALERSAAERERETSQLVAAAREADEERRAAEERAREVRTMALEGEAERAALRAALVEERDGGALERLARLLATRPPPPRAAPAPAAESGAAGAERPAGGDSGGDAGHGARDASIASRIALLTSWAEQRVSAAEIAAKAAEDECSRLRLALDAAPTAEAMKAQAAQAAEARGNARALAVQLREARRDAAALVVRCDAASVRAQAAESALAMASDAGRAVGVLSPRLLPSAADGRPGAPSAPPAAGWARATAASAQRHSGAPRVVASRRSPMRSGEGARVARAGTARGAARPRAGVEGEAARCHEADDGDPSVVAVQQQQQQLTDVASLLLEHLASLSRVVASPPPKLAEGSEGAGGEAQPLCAPGVLEAEEEEEAGEACGEGGARGGDCGVDGDGLMHGGGGDPVEAVRTRAAAVLQRVAAFVDMAQELVPAAHCVRRVQSALRSRRALRSAHEAAADGTLEGVVAEVARLVEAEAHRAADLAAAPPGVAQHVLRRLQGDLEVSSIGEIPPRVAELTRVARQSLTLLLQLRQSLDLDSGASMGACIAAAARLTHSHTRLSEQCAGLCAMLGVRSLDALAPAVRQLAIAAAARPTATPKMPGPAAASAEAASAIAI